MNQLLFLLLSALTEVNGPMVEVATLSGDQHRGTMLSLSSESIELKTDQASVSVPISELLLIRSSPLATAVAHEDAVNVRLVDGSQLRIRAFSSTGTMAKLTHARWGEVQVPVTSLSSVRFAAADPKIDIAWSQLIERVPKKDLVAIRKGDVLDHLDGVIGSLTDATLQFQLDGDEITVKRNKIFGLAYSKRESTAKKAIALLDVVSGDRLAIKKVHWNGTVWQIRLVSDLELEVSPSDFQTLDFSQGKITYLSDLEPRSVEYTPYFPHFEPFSYRRDKNFEGGRIGVGQQTFAKGLAIHSRTLLKYRLGGDFRRFQAIMGIGDELSFGIVDVVIKGDKRVLFKGSAQTPEPDTAKVAAPQTLDLDVTGVAELEIFVDYGSDQRDIGDRLYLANARVIK